MRKYIFTGLFLTLYSLSFAQKPGWQHLDLQKDSVFGISTGQAYNELLKGKKAKTVVAAIVDTGIDTLQEDLQSVIWADPKTGHHGWNYIGPETGQEDITKLVGKNKDLYDSLAYTTVPEKYRAGYQQHMKLSPGLDAKIEAMRSLQIELLSIEKLTNEILLKLNKPSPTAADLKAYSEIATPEQKQLIVKILKRLGLYANWQAYRYNEIDHILQMVEFHLEHGLNIDNKEPDTAKGNFDVSPDKLGPVAEVNLGGAYHGTHVAGIIGAVRGNGIGMDGIADHVQILMLKDNGTLREMRDDKVALAIRYAVDHGAKVINMSFGKPYTWNKKAVDDAVEYAMKKDVLIVAAAGNDGKDLDKEEHYPNPVYLNKRGKALAWLEVGASGFKNDSTLPASFSNYGKNNVDVFAPGVDIYSTFPYNQYHIWSGTSMAAPMVTGLAALIREYYPKLTAVQVHDIIMRSVVRSPYLKDKCVSGGVINAYNALKLAATYNR